MTSPSINIKQLGQRSLNKIFTYRVILQLIMESRYQADIAQNLRWSKQKVNYWFRKLEHNGLIREEVTSSIKIFEVTSKGKDFLMRSENVFKSSLFLHGLGLKFSILDSDSRFDCLDWRDVKLRNWIKKTTKYHDVQGDFSIVRTTKNLIIWCKERNGVHPYQLFFESIRDVLRVARILQLKYGIKLGSPSMVKKPHFGLVDPLLVRVNEEVYVTGIEEWTDNSPASGSVEYFDPRRIVQYLRMPERVDDMAKELGKVAEELKVFGEGMKEHMKLISALQELSVSLKKVADSLLETLRRLNQQ